MPLPVSADELGDANTATTSDPHWYAAAKTTNALGNNGYFLAYASNTGLTIYNGADYWYSDYPTQSLTDLFLSELNQQFNPDNLPSSTPLEVMDYKQNCPASICPNQGGTWAGSATASPPWSDSPNLDLVTSCDTIHKSGCALTSVANVAYSYGIRTIPGTGMALDPGTLNTYLNGKGWANQKYPCYMYWDIAASSLGLALNKHNGVVYPATLSARLTQALSDGNLPIIEITWPNPSHPNDRTWDNHHWVVVVNQVGSDYRIADPWYPASPTNLLSADYPSPSHTITDVEVLDRGSHPGGNWSITMHSPAQFLVTDPNGQVTGYVASSGTTISNIPGAYYSISQGLSDDTGVDPPLPDIPFFENNSPIPGTYTVQVIGTGSGPYTLDFSSSSDSGSISQSSISGITSAGQVDTFEVQVSGGTSIIQQPTPLPTSRPYIPVVSMPTATSTPTATATSVHATNTATATATATAIPPTATSTRVPPTATATPVPTLIIYHNARTEVGGRKADCTIAGNTKGAHEPGCEIVSGISAPGATVVYTLKYADGATQTFTDTADFRGHSLHPFNVAYMPPKGSKHGQPATVAYITVTATLKNGTSLGPLAARFAVIR